MLKETVRKVLTGEAVEVDGTEKAEKFDTMLREFGEILVDHFQCALEYIFHDNWDLIFHERL